MISPWLAYSSVDQPPRDRVQFFAARTCVPARCPRCGGAALRTVPDGLACVACPWHAVVREAVLASLQHGYVASRPAVEYETLDDRGGVSTRFFRARRFCST